jgi:flagellar protein FliJ
MKRFQFRLDSVLTLRNWEEERARTAYAFAMQQERRLLEQIKELEQRMEAAMAGLRPSDHATIAAGERATKWRHARALERERADTQQKLASARRIREQKMKLLLDAHRRVQVLENLKTRQKQAHLTEMRQREEREIDDFVIARFQPDL